MSGEHYWRVVDSSFTILETFIRYAGESPMIFHEVLFGRKIPLIFSAEGFLFKRFSHSGKDTEVLGLTSFRHISSCSFTMVEMSFSRPIKLGGKGNAYHPIRNPYPPNTLHNFK